MESEEVADEKAHDEYTSAEPANISGFDALMCENAHQKCDDCDEAPEQILDVVKGGMCEACGITHYLS